MAISLSSAVTIAQMALNQLQGFGSNYILLPERAKETPLGWLLPWARSDFRATKEVTIGGNSPFFVDKQTGAICQVNTSIVDFEASHGDYAAKRGVPERD